MLIIKKQLLRIKSNIYFTVIGFSGFAIKQGSKILEVTGGIKGLTQHPTTLIIFVWLHL